MNDLSEFVTLTNTTLTTDSRRVARHFHKSHKSVLRAFDNIDFASVDGGEEFRQRNFAPADEVDAQGKPRRVVLMTKNGFILLVMGFQGAQAMTAKIAYIGAFDAMAAQLQQIATDGFRNLWDQRLELEKKDATTFMWASFGAKRMVERRKELPGIKEERERLEGEMQPPLFRIGVH